MHQHPNRSLTTITLACVSAISLIPFTSNAVAASREALPQPPPTRDTLSPTLLSSKGFSSSIQVGSSPTMQMPMVAPLFIQDQNFASTLVLVNGSGLSTYADVFLIGLDGREIKRQRVEFTPHSQRQVEVYQLLQAAVSPATTGRIAIMQSPDLKGMAIGAQLSMTFKESSENYASYIDEEAAMPSAQGSQTLRAVADSGEGSPLVAIANLSEAGQHIAIQCLTDKNQNFSKSVDLLAGETLLTEACSDQTTNGAAIESFSSTDSKGQHGPVGISLTGDGMPGSLAAFGLSRHKKGDKESFSAISFTDPKMLRSLTTIFAGVPVGPANLVSDGIYTPELSLANFSPKDLQVRVQYAQESGTTPTTKEIAALTVPAGTTRAIAFDNLQGDAQLQNSFLVTSNGSPGDLAAKLVSRNDSALTPVELLGKDENDPSNGGGHPWSLEQGTESTLLLFNPSDEHQKFTVAIQSESVLWQKTYMLDPMETKAIGVRDLIRDEVKDDQGKVLPAHSVSGEVGWFTAANGKGRVLQSNSKFALARNFSCPLYYALCGIEFSPDTTTLLIGDQGVAFGRATGQVCNVYAGQCNGNFSYYGDNSYSYNWSGDTSGVFQVSGTSFDGVYSHANVNAVNGGAGGVGVTVSGWINGGAWYCSFYADPKGSVQVPTSLQRLSWLIISDTAPLASGGAGCSTAQNYSMNIQIQYQVLDQNQAALKSSKMEPQEKDLNPIVNGQNLGSDTDWGDLGGHNNFPGTSVFTNANGQFVDAPVGICIGVPFTETDTQIISILLNGKRYPVSTDPNAALRTNNWTIRSSSAGHGSITNGTDVTASK